MRTAPDMITHPDLASSYLRALSLGIFAAALAGCHDPVPCGGCPDDRFCCVDACLPLGSVCGGGQGPDGGVVDGGSDGGSDGSTPCAIHDGATSVARACSGTSSFTTCVSMSLTACNYTCAEWVDGTGTLQAACMSQGQTVVCDPSVVTSHCDGTSIVFCNGIQPIPGDPEPTPPGWLVTSDCTKTWAADATCKLDGGTPYCSSPSDVSCDPSTFVETCAQLCVDQGSHSALRPFACAGGEQCVQNGACTSPTCLPASATMSALPATLAQVYLDCPSASSVHIEQCGYEWDTDCSTTSLSGKSTICYTPKAGLVECITPSEQTCDPATAPASCIDGQTRSYCAPDYIYNAQACLLNMICTSGLCCDPTLPAGSPPACPP